LGLAGLRSEEIQDSVRSGKLKIGVFGLGWMGLPTACLLLDAGATVIGADIDAQVVEQVNSGKSPIQEPGVEQILSRNVHSRLSATSNLREAAAQSDVVMIIVPTSINAEKKPDYAALEKDSREIGMKLKAGSLVIVQSTVGPGVTESIVKPLIEKASGFKAGEGFFLAYSPIRAMAGQVMKDVRTYPRIVGGINDESGKTAGAVLGTIVNGGIILVRDMRTAEAVKLFENTYRDLNIALANELACLCEELRIDFQEVRQAANSQPYCHLHLPSVGVGGHCIPVNPYFLIAAGRAAGVDLPLVRQGRRINDRMPRHTFALVEKALQDCKRSVGRSSVAVLGLSFREDVKEERYSPSKEVIQLLQRKGARVRVYDPYFTSKELKAMGYNAFDSLERTVTGVNCILVAVSHLEFKTIRVQDLARMIHKPGCIVEAGLHRIFDPAEVGANNLVYYGIGYGHESKQMSE
jgi:UDP-N-acetyl-D-mannosaminuronic acid dehydrogenase